MTERRFVTVDGARLEAMLWPGEDLPILLLHEGLGSVAMWRDFPARLAEESGHAVIAWSRRGHGASDRLHGSREPDYMHREAEHLPQLLDALGVECAHLLGHSDGGSIALIAAAKMPERVASLILEAPHVFVEELTVKSIASIKHVYQSSLLGERLGRYHDDADHVFWQWNDIWLDGRFGDWSIEELLPAVSARALLIQGRDDEYGTLEQLDRIEAVLPDTRRLELDNCGHSPHRDQCRAVLDAISGFLEEYDEWPKHSSAQLQSAGPDAGAGRLQRRGT